MDNLLVGLVTGAFGMAYFVYGKRQTRFVPMIAGVLLCVYPYFVQNLFWSLAIGALLLATPFLFRH
ncbi:MAG: hypothetical protein ACKVP2_08370 [Burkholderiales bacterium]